jgi:hypothetical protein
MLCNALNRAGDIDDAVRHGEMAVGLGERIGDERRIAWANIMLDQCYNSLLGYCDPVEAQKYCSKAKGILARIGDYRGLTWLLNTEADIAFVNTNTALAVATMWENAEGHPGSVVGKRQQLLGETTMYAFALRAAISLVRELDRSRKTTVADRRPSTHSRHVLIGTIATESLGF